MAFNPLHPRFIQSSVPRSMANASNGAPNPTIDEASSIQIVKESIRLVTGDSIKGIVERARGDKVVN